MYKWTGSLKNDDVLRRIVEERNLIRITKDYWASRTLQRIVEGKVDRKGCRGKEEKVSGVKEGKSTANNSAV